MSVSPSRIADRPNDGVLDDRLPDEVRASVRKMMRVAHVPGLSIAVVRHDRPLYADAFGTASLAGQVPATTRTRYLWFSMTKVVTATAALRLADEGRLDLDAPACEYVDELAFRGRRQPTTRQLLTHTAGLANPLPIRWVHPARGVAPAPGALLRRQLAKRRSVRSEPGVAVRYSNLGYLAAAEVVSAAARTGFTELVRTAVLEPAGMTATGFDHRPGAPTATGYVRVPAAVTPLLRRVLPAGVAGSREGGHLALNPFLVDGPGYGGLVGDVVDAARFLRLHLGDGEIDGRRVLDTRTAREMRRIVATGKPFDHATGWFRKPVADAAGDYVEHYGSGAGFWNVMRLYPEQDLGIVVMSNGTASYDFPGLFAELVNTAR